MSMMLSLHELMLGHYFTAWNERIRISVFCKEQNFEWSYRICSFSQNFCFLEFSGIFNNLAKRVIELLKTEVRQEMTKK